MGQLTTGTKSWEPIPASVQGWQKPHCCSISQECHIPMIHKSSYTPFLSSWIQQSVIKLIQLKVWNTHATSSSILVPSPAQRSGMKRSTDWIHRQISIFIHSTWINSQIIPLFRTSAGSRGGVFWIVSWPFPTCGCLFDQVLKKHPIVWGLLGNGKFHEKSGWGRVMTWVVVVVRI